MPQIAQRRVRFGCFELDPRAGELCGNGQRTVLQEQQLKVLLMLVERAGEIATREEIKKKLWPNDTIVEFDFGINSTIKKLRGCLGDSAQNPHYIETLARRGYRLIVPVEWFGATDSSGEEFSADSSSDGSRSDAGDDSNALPKAELKVGRLTGKIVSHYRVLEVIGGGGMGLVYRAEDLKLGRAVALKFLPEEVGDDPKARERFEREAHAVSALDHPNICTIYNFEDHEGHPFIAMQLLQGETLRDHLADGRFRLTESDGLEIAIQIASGLEAAHEKGIIHRDIKPANIFITERNVAKILDFGVAKVLSLSEATRAVTLSDNRREESKEPCSEEDTGVGVLRLVAEPQGGSLGMTPKETSLTRTGMKLGTAGYMSPEQIRGEPLDARTDIFSFGLVLYEMATGERAFTGETEAILHDAIQHREPTPVLGLAPEVAQNLDAIIAVCLQKHREQRYQTMWEVTNELRVLEQTASPSKPVWKRAEALRQNQRTLNIVAAVLVFVALAVAAFLYRRLSSTVKLTPKRGIVLAGIANKTGDKIFDKSLDVALSYALLQTPALDLLSTDKILKSRNVLSIVGQSPLSANEAMQICKYTKSSAVLAGSISDSGNNYHLDLEATDCMSGGVLARSVVVASEREQVVRTLGIAAYDIRRQMGESKESLREFNQPLEIATTSSLDSLQMLAEYVDKGAAPETIPSLKRAVELDPQFEVGHYALGQTYFDTSQTRLAIQEYRAAYDLRQRASVYFRLQIEEGYFNATGQLDLAMASLKHLREQYGRSAIASDMSLFYRYLGAREEAREEAEKAVRELPGSVFPYLNLESAYQSLGRFEQAQHVVNDAVARGLESPWLDMMRYKLAFLTRDDRGMQSELLKARGRPGYEDLLLDAQADTEAYFGRFRKAHELTREAVASTMKNETFMAGYYVASAAMDDAEVGYWRRFPATLSGLIGRDAQPEVLKMAGLALARSGMVKPAAQIISRLNADAPLDTLTQKYYIPIIQAAIDLQQGNPAKAVADVQPSTEYELGGTGTATLYPAYIRGVAYLQLGNGQDAVREFKKLLDNPGVVVNAVIGALAYLQLARAYAVMGDKEAARRAYQDFLTLWKDADSDIPILQEAKREYALLKQ